MIFVIELSLIYTGNKFFLSSTTFSPSLFLSQVHSTASTQDLLDGLDILSRSIDQKSASLKGLVGSNFERFVRAKATIDNVYKEMKYQGEEPIRPRTHSRHASKNSFRSSNINRNSTAIQPSDKKKRCALVKESEYGVLGIKSHLLDVSAKADEIWGPALGGHETESNLRLMATSIEQFKEQYQICGSIAYSITRKDYEAIVEDYNKAKRFADDAKMLAENLGTKSPTDLQILQILLAVHVWSDVEEMIEDLKTDLWRNITATHHKNFSKNESITSLDDHYMDLIETLLELGVDKNPIWVLLRSRHNHLKSKIVGISERSKIEIEILRRRLRNFDKPKTLTVILNLKSLERHVTESKPISVDSPTVIEFWERTKTFLCDLISNQGVLGEIIELWQTVRNLTDGRAKRIFTTDMNQNSSQFLRLSPEESAGLQKGIIELVDMIRECIYGFFLGPPVDDISSLFSPDPTTPLKSSKSTQFNTTSDFIPNSRIKNDQLYSSSSKTGEAWENFTFWPPLSNSLSGVHYLGQFLFYIGSGANEMATIFSGRQDDDSSYESLKSFVSGIRECCVTAICLAWNKDAEEIKVLEDWRRSPDNHDLTKIPMYFGAFGSAILSGVQKILYIPEALAKNDAVNVINPPSAKLLQIVRSQFVSTLYKSLSGLVENAEKSVKKEDDDWMPELNIDASQSPAANSFSIGAETANSNDRVGGVILNLKLKLIILQNVRMLLTLSNMQALQNNVIPNLVIQFENAFSVKLTDESKKIQEALTQINANLFSSFIRPFVESLRDIIHSGITSPSWVPLEKPQQVGPYVYKILLSLVLLHSQVFTTTLSLTGNTLSYLLEQISLELFETLKLRKNWTLPALMQATLDVEFVSQTLSQYTTDKASEIQSRIYEELDKGTDSKTRAELQTELPEMRSLLKRLRDVSRAEFICFKKSRSRNETVFATTEVTEQMEIN